MSALNELDRLRAIVEPIASDLDLDVYDIERRGSTVRIMLDTPPGSDGGITLDNLSLATRLISREIDHEDPIPTKFTLEISSPGLERPLRTPAHFAREIGKPITIRFRDPDADPRRIEGTLVGADDDAATLRFADDTDQVVRYGDIDKARTVFEFGPTPKPGGPKSGGKPGTKPGKPGTKARKPGTKAGKNNLADVPVDADENPKTTHSTDNKEKQTS
jgi:ribosome maturation factor RimP